MTARELFQIAYSAARAAKVEAERTGLYHSPSTLSEALDATFAYRDCPARFRIAMNAANTAELSRATRVRSSMRVLVRPRTAGKLYNHNARFVR